MTKIDKLLARIRAAELAARHGLRESRPSRSGKRRHERNSGHHKSTSHAHRGTPKRPRHHGGARKGER